MKNRKLQSCLLKLAEIMPLFKKADPFHNTNYRPVSLLSQMSKVFGRIIFNQINY